MTDPEGPMSVVDMGLTFGLVKADEMAGAALTDLTSPIPTRPAMRVHEATGARCYRRPGWWRALPFSGRRRNGRMMRGNGRHGIALLGILFPFVAVAAWYSVAISVGEGVDETDHFAYVRFVRDRRALPVQAWQGNGEPLRLIMGYHAPLYYVLAAGAIS